MVLEDIKKISNEQLINLRTYTPYELESKLSEYFISVGKNIQLHLKDGALCDCIFNIFVFSNEEDLSDNDFILLYKLILSILINCQQGFTKQQNLTFFKSSLAKEQESEEIIAGCLSLTTIKKIIDYALLSIFQHYDLYCFMLLGEHTEQVINKELSIEVVPTPQPYPSPLEESICEEWYNMYVNPIVEQQYPNHDETNDIAEALRNDALNNISADDAEYFMSNIDPDHVKRLITEQTVKRLTDVKMEMEKKINEKESLLMKTVNKV